MKDWIARLIGLPTTEEVEILNMKLDDVESMVDNLEEDVIKRDTIIWHLVRGGGVVHKSMTKAIESGKDYDHIDEMIEDAYLLLLPKTSTEIKNAG